MKLGDNILKLRKDCKLSHPEQLKLLSKALNVSIDELLNNDIKLVLVEKLVTLKNLPI